MTKTTIITMAAALALGLASCAKEGTDKISAPDAKGAGISFSFNAPVGKYITYADGEIAVGDEWTINSLDLYAFDNTGALIGKLGEATDYTKEVTDRSSTVTLSQEWIVANFDKRVSFYFVANDATGEATNAPHIVAFDGNLAAFKALATNPLVAGTDDTKFVNISTPLLFSGTSAEIAITGGKISEEVSLKRREARFDIVNELKDRFVINRVLISGARRQGYIWDAPGNNVTGFAQVNMEPVMVDADDFAYNTAEGNDTEWINKGVFYLYPTNFANTNIFVMGSIDSGPEKAYEVVAATTIEANKRYKLIASQGQTIEDEVIITVVTADYEEGASIDITPKAETVSIGSVTPAANYEAGLFTITDNAGGTATVVVTSSYGTTATFSFTDGGDNAYTTPFAISAPVTTVTYGYLTTDTYTVTLPVLEEGSMGYNIEALFTSKGDAEQGRTVTFKKEGDSEQQMVTVPYENILCYDEEAGLNLDGVGAPLHFKWGSLIGIGPGESNNDEFEADDILWVPDEYVGTYGGLAGLKEAIIAIIGNSQEELEERWSLIPFGDGAAFRDVFPENTPDNIRAGLGDPCRFATKNGTGKGSFKMPEMVPDGQGGITWFETIRSGAEDWAEFKGVYGRWNEAGTQFYPAAGTRRRDIGTFSFPDVYEFGDYWSSSGSDGIGYHMDIHITSVKLFFSDVRNLGFSVRCVPAK